MTRIGKESQLIDRRTSLWLAVAIRILQTSERHAVRRERKTGPGDGTVRRERETGTGDGTGGRSGKWGKEKNEEKRKEAYLYIIDHRAWSILETRARRIVKIEFRIEFQILASPTEQVSNIEFWISNFKFGVQNLIMKIWEIGILSKRQKLSSPR